MLTPQELLEVVDTMHPLLDELNEWITTDLIRRLMARLARGESTVLGATDQWQLALYKAAGGHYEELTAKLKEWTKKCDAEIQSIFEDAGIRAWNADDAFYTLQGFESTPLLKSESLMRVLVDAWQRTNGEVHNLTRTTASQSEQRFMDVCDRAHMKVQTGAQSYTAAVKEAVDELCEQQTTVRYPTGHTDSIETAVLRCVRTGTAQASGNLSVQGMIDHDWDLVRVSAHLGARYGDGSENPSNHFWWQGKLYSRSGKAEDLPDFVACTGYGTGEGLCGWNCRHSFGPGTRGFNPWKDYDAEENKRVYDLSQRQRAMERGIRKSKLKLRGYQAAIDACTDDETRRALREEYGRTAERLSAQNAAYNKFCADNDLRRMDDRLRIAKWNRSEATKAARAASAAKLKANAAHKDSSPAVPTSAPEVQHSGYADVTQRWYDTATPNSHEVRDAQEVTKDGVTYRVDGHNVKLEYSDHEKEIAELLEREFGGELYMNPKVNFPQGVRIADYRFRGENWDLKTLTKKATRDTIFQRIKNSNGQACKFVIDVSNAVNLTDEIIEAQIKKVFKNSETDFVDEIIFARDAKIQRIVRRA